MLSNLLQTFADGAERERYLLVQSRLDSIIETVPGVIWEIVGANVPRRYKVSFVSGYIEHLLGYTAAEVVQNPSFCSTLIHPEDAESACEALEEILADGSGALRCRLRTRDGRYLWTEARCRVVRDDAGKTVGVRGVTMDITKRMQAEETTRRNELAQREFIANVSHDFRTPLAAIRGYSETLLRGGLRDRRNRERFAHTILRNAERLECLVDDLLLLTALESGKLSPQPEPLPLASLVAGHFDDMAVLLKRKGLEARLQVDRGLFVKADKAQLDKVLQNLLANAVKYNRPGGWIRVRADAGAGKILVAVKDSGIGMAPEHLPRIFDRFYRIDKARPRERGESGLGLHIARQLVESTGNRIWVNSAAGRGTTFYFTLDPAPAPV